MAIVPCNPVYAVTSTVSVAGPIMASSTLSYAYATTISISIKSVSGYNVKSPGFSDCDLILGRKRFARSTRNDPTIDPNTNITGFPGWGPVLDIDLSPSICQNWPNAQYETFEKGKIGRNACSNIALTMIASIYSGGKDIFSEIRRLRYICHNYYMLLIVIANSYLTIKNIYCII